MIFTGTQPLSRFHDAGPMNAECGASGEDGTEEKRGNEREETKKRKNVEQLKLVSSIYVLLIFMKCNIFKF